MARVDQDNFSNISWQSEGPGAASSSSGPSRDGPPGPEQANGREQQQQLEPQPNLDRLDAGGLGSDTLECIVSAPITENEGTSTNFVSYLVTTNVGGAVSLPLSPSSGSPAG